RCSRWLERAELIGNRRGKQASEVGVDGRPRAGATVDLETPRRGCLVQHVIDVEMQRDVPAAQLHREVVEEPGARHGQVILIRRNTGEPGDARIADELRTPGDPE